MRRRLHSRVVLTSLRLFLDKSWRCSNHMGHAMFGCLDMRLRSHQRHLRLPNGMVSLFSAQYTMRTRPTPTRFATSLAMFCRFCASSLAGQTCGSV